MGGRGFKSRSGQTPTLEIWLFGVCIVRVSLLHTLSLSLYIYIYSKSGRNFSVFPAKLGGNNSKLVPKVHFSFSQHQKHGHFEFLPSRWQTLLFLLRRAEGPCFHVEKNIKNVIHRPWWVCVGKSCSSRLELDPRPAALRRTKDVRHMFIIFTVGTSQRVWMG